VAFLDQGRLLIDGELDSIKEQFVRVLVPPALATQMPEPLAGELRRRSTPEHGLRLLLDHTQHQSWPQALRDGALRFDPLGLEDLFLEVVE
jgi:hypothetical protein